MYNKMNNKEMILKELFDNPITEFHIRLLARKTGLNPNTIINITNELLGDNLIVKRKETETNRVIIKANFDDELFRAKKKAYNIERIIESKVLDFLNDELSHPTVVLFGSYAKAENDNRSDIDLFVIADEKKKLDLFKFEKILGAEIQIFLHTKKELNKLKEGSKELINNVINGIILTGYFEVL